MKEDQCIDAMGMNNQCTDKNWIHFDLDNFELCMAAFADARQDKLPRAIDGNTGSGKTYAAKQYQRLYPQSVVIITCAGDLSVKGFIREMALAMKLNPEGTAYTLRHRITKAIGDLQHPLLIIDEAENLKDTAWQSLKAMMDALVGICAIIIIGANEFEGTISKKANRLKNPFPQVYSRLKLGGITHLLQLPRKEVKFICKTMSITDDQVIKYLCSTVSNMRELEGAVRKLIKESREDQCDIDINLALEVL